MADAYRVTPLLLELEDQGRERSGVLRVENTTDRPLTIETALLDWTISETGERVTAPSDDPVLIFPPQAVIPVGASQTIRVEWIGGPIEQAEDYIILIEQLPVSFAEGEDPGSGVEFLFTFGAALHVSPQSADARPVLEAAIREDDRMRIRIRNAGGRHFYLGSAGLDMVAGGDSIRLAGEALSGEMGNTLIAAGAVREFTLPVPETMLSQSDIQIVLPERI